MTPLFSPSPKAPSGLTAHPVALPRLWGLRLRTGVLHHAPVCHISKQAAPNFSVASCNRLATYFSLQPPQEPPVWKSNP